MKSKFIALVTAAAIATAGMAPTAAQADKARDIAGLLIGIAAIAAIAEAANNGNTRVTVNRGYTPRTNVAPRRHDVRTHNSPRRQDVRNHHLPRQCLVRQQTRHGWVKYYGKRCMARMGWTQRGNHWVQHRHVHN